MQLLRLCGKNRGGLLHLDYLKRRVYLPYPTWEEYAYASIDRFRFEYVDHMVELKLVKQIGMVDEH